MASVFKRSYLWLNPKTGRKVRRKCSKWTAKYKGADGLWKTRPAYGDKESSQTLARKLERQAERERMGLRDPFEEHEATELSAHLNKFEEYLRAKGDCPDHVRRTKSRIQAIIDGCDFEKIAEINGSDVVTHFATLRESGQFGKRTSNYYLQAVKEFTRWMVRNRRTAADPLVHLAAIIVDEEPARARRAVSGQQFAAIVTAADRGPAVKMISGPDRAMLYMVAAYTGYRAHELSSVTPESFVFEDDRAELAVVSGYSKRRKLDSQPLRSDLAVRVKAWLNGRAAGQPLWPGKWYDRAAEMLQIDLAAAEVPYVDRGRHLDFHALRYTYITSLHRSGTYGKVLQALARHSTPTLTAGYVHVEVSDVDAAVDALPPLPAAAKKSRRQQSG